MIIVAHRVNTLEALERVPAEYGIEFDVREGVDGPCVTHDPWTPSVALDTFLAHCRHSFYIVNIKCEGIEPRVLEMLKSHSIESFFLLDCSIPMIVRLSRQGERRFAVRLSEYESIETVMSFSRKVNWVWVDVFTRVPVTPSECQRLKDAGFGLCLVSPELQGRPEALVETAAEIGASMDMVCTKMPTAWTSA